MIGILGVGHLATTVLTGFLRAGLPAPGLLLSPRGKARAFSETTGVPLANDNYDLVERSDIVLLAVRPADVTTAVTDLPWRSDQTVISVCAGLSLKHIPVLPARVVRAMPLTAAEINSSPTVCFPPDPRAIAVLERLGPVIALESETQFELATVNAAVYGWAQDLIRTTVEWSAEQGADPAIMRRLVGLTFAAAGSLLAEKPDPMSVLLEELVTPGGITELGLKVLAKHRQTEAWQEACAAVLGRLTRSPQNNLN